MSLLRKLTAAVLTIAVAASALLAVPAEALNTTNRMYAQKYNLLIGALKNDEETLKALKEFKRAVVFFSVSDGKSKAKVSLSQSWTLDTALTNAYQKIKSTGVTPKWLKLDVVISDEEMSYSDFVDDTAGRRVNGMRKGIAFNDYYGLALMESQLNSNAMINYEEGTLDLKKVNAELKEMGKKKLDSKPKTLRLFKTQGYFAENTAYAQKLINKSYNNVGRRELDPDRATIEMIAQKSSGYLKSICDKHGKFVYGYYPIDNEEIAGYNILRHAGTTWNLIMQYDMCRDESLVPVIKSALGYLKQNLQYKNKNTAFVVDGAKLNVGGNGLALLAYCTYAEVFCSSEYNSVIKALANGVMFMQNKNGSYKHTLYKKNYKIAEKYVIEYYDGEAAYGMLKAYGVLGKKEYLDSTSKAADYFIKKNYTELHSHWMSYVYNEITKYLPYERYFEFGLKNVNEDDYSTNMYGIKSGYNSASETLNASFELYDRLIKGGYECKYLEKFDADMLIKAVVQRAKYGLNYFMFPEYAMYFKDPTIVLNSFAVREDNFRIRIDDIQHFMDGYYLYWKNCDLIPGHKERLKKLAEEAAAAEPEDEEQEEEEETEEPAETTADLPKDDGEGTAEEEKNTTEGQQ